MEYPQLILADGENLEDQIIATYSLHSEEDIDMLQWAIKIAIDQSAGTWTAVEDETPEIRKKHCASVVGYYPVTRDNSHASIARIAFPIANFPICLSMVLSTTAGNVLAQRGIRLLDLEFSASALKNFAGPMLGVKGMREMLGVYDRPLVGAILKPCIGVTPEVSARSAAKAAAGGIDMIKDDELLSDTGYSPLVQRVRAIMKALNEVNRDRDKKVLYAANITGPGSSLLDRAKAAIDAGANALMINHYAVGWTTVELLTEKMREEGYQVPILGHMAGMGGVYGSDHTGISSYLLCGKLPRLSGLDMVVVYPDFGRFGFSTAEFVRIVTALNAEYGSIAQTMPFIAGGLHPGRVTRLMNLLGEDIILVAGGGIYGHPMGSTAGAKAMMTAVTSASAGIPLEEAARDSKELKVALDCWGIG